MWKAAVTAFCLLAGPSLVAAGETQEAGPFIGLGWMEAIEHRGTAWHVAPSGDDTTGDGSEGAPFATIAHALGLAAAGDTVQLAPGSYLEHELFLKSGVTVQGDPAAPPAAVIDAQRLGRVFVAAAVDTAAVLRGLTVTGGLADHGGGLLCTNGAAPRVVDCIFTGNEAVLDGGGIRSNGSLPTFVRCSFTSNLAGGHGGGLYLFGDSNARLDSCTIAGNTAADGGGLRCYLSAPRLTACSITGNVAHLGAGVYCYNRSAPLFENCTIAGNAASQEGGGLRCVESTPSLTRTILYANCSAVGAELQLVDPLSAVSFSCCAVDTSAGWLAGAGLVTWLGVNLSEDPLFCSPEDCSAAPTSAGDYAVREDSPCLPGSNGCGELIGAAGTGCEAPTRTIHVATWGDDVTGDGSAGNPVATIQRGIDLATPGDMVLVDSGTYTGSGNREIDFLGKAITVRSAAGDPELCIIDLADAVPYTGFYFHSGEDSTSVLDSFTIQNGVATHWVSAAGGDGLAGAAICCDHASPLLQNLVLRHNGAPGGWGGAIAMEFSYSSLRNCKIADNTSGGVFLYESGGILSNCEIVGNLPGPVMLQWSDTKFDACTLDTGYLYALGMDGYAEFRDCLLFAETSGHHGAHLKFYNCTISGAHQGFFENVVEFHGCTFSGCQSGAIDIGEAGSLLLEDCLFEGNAATRGGAVYVHGGIATTMLRCRFVGNTAGLGGGAVCYNSGDALELVDCEFLGNSVTGGAGGGAILVLGGPLSLVRCTVAGNEALAGTAGGAIAGSFVGVDSLIIQDCVVVGNYSTGNGGAISVASYPGELSHAFFQGSTIAANTSAGTGGAVAATEAIVGRFDSTILWGNCAEMGGDELAIVGTGSIHFTCCDVDSAGIAGGTITYAGINMFVDPGFCDPIACAEAPFDDETGFGLRSDSPCLPENNDCGVRIGALGPNCPLTAVPGILDGAVAVLGPSYPNPFNPRTTIPFCLSAPAMVTVSILDVNGRLVATLAEGREFAAGRYELRLNAVSAAGRQLPAGVYLCRLEAGGVVKTSKLVLLK